MNHSMTSCSHNVHCVIFVWGHCDLAFYIHWKSPSYKLEFNWVSELENEGLNSKWNFPAPSNMPTNTFITKYTLTHTHKTLKVTKAGRRYTHFSHLPYFSSPDIILSVCVHVCVYVCACVCVRCWPFCNVAPYSLVVSTVSVPAHPSLPPVSPPTNPPPSH